MLTFVFSPHIQAGITAGRHKQVYSSTGVALSIARGLDGRFVGNAVGAVISYGNSVSPLIGGLQMIQIHKGFQATYGRFDVIKASLQALQNSVEVLQATIKL